MHKEFIWAGIFVLVFGGAVAMTLWAQQPPELNVSINTTKHLDHRIGITPQFDEISPDTVSYYQAQINIGSPAGRTNDDYNYNVTPPDLSDGLNTAWVSNEAGSNDCLEITTTVTAYDENGEFYQSDKDFSCVKSLPNPVNISQEQKRKLRKDYQNLNVSLKPYFEASHKIGYEVTFDTATSADEYEIRHYGQKSGINLENNVTLEKPQTIRLQSVQNKDANTCLDQTIAVSAYDKQDKLIGLDIENRCDQSRNDINTGNQSLDVEVSFQHRWTADPQPQTGVNVEFSPVANTYYYDFDYEATSMDGTVVRDQKIFPRIERETTAYNTVWLYNPYSPRVAEDAERDCLQIKTTVEAVTKSGEIIASSSDSSCVQHTP